MKRGGYEPNIAKNGPVYTAQRIKRIRTIEIENNEGTNKN